MKTVEKQEERKQDNTTRENTKTLLTSTAAGIITKIPVFRARIVIT